MVLNIKEKLGCYYTVELRKESVQNIRDTLEHLSCPVIKVNGKLQIRQNY